MVLGWGLGWGLGGEVGAVAQIPADAATCWKRISHPVWNEGLLKTTATEAGERIKWHRTCCADVCVVHACAQSFTSSQQTHPHVHAVLVPVRRVCCWLLTPQFTMLYTPEAGRRIERQEGGHWNTCSQATQAAPTCYRDMNIDHRTVLDCSNSFLHPSCPYWFGPSPPRCAPVVLITNTLSFFPAKERKHMRREERRKKSRVEGREGSREEKQRRRDKKRHWLWQERHQTSPPPPALDRQELGAPGRYLLLNTWAYQTTALSYIF